MFVYVCAQSFPKKCGSLWMVLCVGQMLSVGKLGLNSNRKWQGSSALMEKCKKTSKTIFLKSIRKKWSGFVFYILCFTSPVWLLSLESSPQLQQKQGEPTGLLFHIFLTVSPTDSKQLQHVDKGLQSSSALHQCTAMLVPRWAKFSLRVQRWCFCDFVCIKLIYKETYYCSIPADNSTDS